MHLKVLGLQETEYCNKNDDIMLDSKKSINMTKPRRFILSGNNTIQYNTIQYNTIQYMSLALFVTGLEHRKIEPTTKHNSLWRKTHRTWPKKDR